MNYGRIKNELRSLSILMLTAVIIISLPTSIFALETEDIDQRSRGNRLNQKPVIGISEPINNSEVKGTIYINGSAWDDGQVLNVTIKILSSTFYATDTGGFGNFSTWSYTMDTTQYSNGLMTVYVYAYDNMSSSWTLVNIYINNTVPPNQRPTILIDTPEISIKMIWRQCQ